MQFYCGRLNNFFRFRDQNNSIVFDLLPEQKERLKKGECNLDGIYDEIMKNPKEYVAKVKQHGLNNISAICGVLGENKGRSNGAGKSTIFESISYVLYGRLIRQQINRVKNESIYDFISNENNKPIKGIKESWAEWLFEEKGKLYIVRRGASISGKSKSPLLEFYEVTDGVKNSLASHRTGDTSALIEKIAGYDFEVFCSSIMFGQDDSGQFLIGKDKDRKEMLIKILHLEDVVAGCLDVVRELKNNKEKEVKTVSTKADLIAERLEEKSIEDNKEKIKQLQKNKEELDKKIKVKNNSIEKLSGQDIMKEFESLKSEGLKLKSELENKKKEAEEQVRSWKEMLNKNNKDFESTEAKEKSINSDIADYERKKSIIENSIKEFDENKVKKDLEVVKKAKAAKSKLNEKKLQLVNSDNEIGKDLFLVENQIKHKNEELNSLQDQIEKAGENNEFICDKCKSKVTKEHIVSECDKLTDDIKQQNEKAKELKEKKSTLEKELKTIDGKQAKVEMWLEKESSLNVSLSENSSNKKKIDDYVSFIEKSKKSLIEIEERKKEISSNKKDYEDKIAKINEKSRTDIEKTEKILDEIRVKYKDVAEQTNVIKAEIKKFREEVSALNDEKSKSDSLIGLYNKEITDIESEQKNLIQIKKEIEEKTKEWQRYIVLDSVFGLEGIQTRIVKKYLPTLNRYVSETLALLSNGEMSAQITTNEKSNIDIKISGNTGNSYNMISGGEKGLLRLSLSIGLAMLSFVRTAQKPEMIVLDEIFGSLDPDRKMAVFVLLSKLQEKFERILLISHDPEINDKMPTKIWVKKSEDQNGISRIQKIEYS